jgi:hypothetical protein
MIINSNSVGTKITVSLCTVKHKNHYTWRLGFVISNSSSAATASVPEMPFMNMQLKAIVLIEG